MENFLFSIDLEDQERLYGKTGKTRIDYSTSILLDFLEELNIQITFFVVGEFALENRTLTKKIIDYGHEIGCHSNDHASLDSLNPKSFKNNITNNKNILEDLGAKNIVGFRAPKFSLIKNCEWAYGVLKELDFKYSSSVMPIETGVQYGWNEFGFNPVKKEGILEIPLSVFDMSIFNLPVGGAYLRLIPKFLLNKLPLRSADLISYIHPYDFDFDQPYTKLKKKFINNFFLFYNRKSTIPKISLLAKNRRVIKYIDYFNMFNNKRK